ncbi:MAG: hypothetical protein Q4A54_13740 [Parabacteroides sp.]|nr:hypothetical protein [Parabacteroides sp.]
MIDNKLYQIGLPLDRLSNVLMNWNCYEPRRKVVISPSMKQEDYVVVETRHTELAYAIIKDVQEAKVNILNEPVKIVKI